MVKLVKATKKDIPKLIDFLGEMTTETGEIGFDRKVYEKKCLQSFTDSKYNVNWFLFYDANGKVFGTCHTFSLFNYWRMEDRYYVGGFYIQPNFRGKGYFKILIKQIKEWGDNNGASSLCAFIHEGNKTSIKSFESVGFESGEYSIHFALLDCWNQS